MRLALTLSLSLIAGSVQAHPHEFVEADLVFHLDSNGLLTDISVEWRYDLFTSMLILTDLGMNPAQTDLAADDAPDLQGFDLDWIEGYNGDLWTLADGQPLDLGPPVAQPATLEGGQVVSRHRRALLAPVDPRQAQVVVQVYDPEYYIAYTIAGSPRVEGADCRARVFTADMDTAFAVLEAALAEITASGEADLEGDFPRVGRDFADEVQIDCS
jgi:ABC-type uncharacterized transport system substrate-binding protein